jgi:hypothetical protein
MVAKDISEGGVKPFVYGSIEDFQSAGVVESPQRKQVENKYPLKPENCYKIDENLKLIVDEISSETKKLLTGEADRLYIKELEIRKLSYEGTFNQKNCRDKIEEDRFNESANIITRSAITQETNVLGKNYNEQKIYIGIGALVLLTGLYIVLKK